MHGICSFSDLAQPLVSRLCERLGYPANSIRSITCARNKDLTRQVRAGPDPYLGLTLTRDPGLAWLHVRKLVGSSKVLNNPSWGKIPRCSSLPSLPHLPLPLPYTPRRRWPRQTCRRPRMRW